MSGPVFLESCDCGCKQRIAQMEAEKSHRKWSTEMKGRVGEDLRDPTGLLRIAEGFGGFCVLALYVVGSIFGALICGAVITGIPDAIAALI